MLSRIVAVTIVALLVSLLWLTKASISDEFERHIAGAVPGNQPETESAARQSEIEEWRREYVNLLKTKAERLSREELQKAIQTLQDELQKQDQEAVRELERGTEFLLGLAVKYPGTKAAKAAKAGVDAIRRQMQSKEPQTDGTTVPDSDTSF